MKIAVCVKYAPDAQADRRFSPDGTVGRAGVDGLLSELGEYAVETAVTFAENMPGASITVLTVGPEAAGVAVRRVLQIGAGGGAHVLGSAIHGSCAVSTSLVVAQAIEKIGFGLALTGMASTDAATGVLPAMIAERLEVARVTYAGSLSVEGDVAQVARDTEESVVVIDAWLPAVVSVTDQLGAPRYHSSKGTMAANKKPVATWVLAVSGSWLSRSACRPRARWSTRSPCAQRARQDSSSPTPVAAEFAMSGS